MNLTENNQTQKFTYCAACGGLLKNEYYTFTIENLLGTVFFELDGSDNAFCSKNCACEMLMLLKRENY